MIDEDILIDLGCGQTTHSNQLLRVGLTDWKGLSL